MTSQIAQVAFALLAGGASILIVAGLVLEALHDKKKVRHTSIAEQDRPTTTAPGSAKLPKPEARETSEPDGPATTGSLSSRGRRGKKRQSDERGERRRRRKEKRRSERQSGQATGQTPSASPAEANDG